MIAVVYSFKVRPGVRGLFKLDTILVLTLAIYIPTRVLGFAFLPPPYRGHCIPISYSAAGTHSTGG